MTRLRLSPWFLVLGCAAPQDDGAGESGTGSSGSASASTTAPTTMGDDSSGTTTSASDTTTVGTTVGTTVDDSTSTADATDESESGSTTTAVLDVAGAADCEPGSRPGAAGSTDDWPNDSGVLVNARMPDGYDPTIAVPLVVVFAPAGADAALTEQFTGLTAATLAQGWAIAYVDHISPMSVDIVAEASAIPGIIAQNWCVDPERIYLTGHSDGGTISEVSVAVDVDPPLPRAAAPSAAGVTGGTLGQIGCPAQPVPMMILHSTGDALFPVANGFGADAAQFWVGCNNCQGDPVDDGTCAVWSECDGGTSVAYCEGAGSHGQWPGLNAEILGFFAAAG